MFECGPFDSYGACQTVEQKTFERTNSRRKGAIHFIDLGCSLFLVGTPILTRSLDRHPRLTFPFAQLRPLGALSGKSRLNCI